MAQFIYAYHGGKKPETPEEAQKGMAQWEAWFKDMGDAVVNPGNPVGLSKTVSANGVADNGGANPLSGFTIVQADSIDKAVDMAKGCPILESGSVEIAEIMEMPLGTALARAHRGLARLREMMSEQPRTQKQQPRAKAPAKG